MSQNRIWLLNIGGFYFVRVFFCVHTHVARAVPSIDPQSDVGSFPCRVGSKASGLGISFFSQQPSKGMGGVCANRQRLRCNVSRILSWVGDVLSLDSSRGVGWTQTNSEASLGLSFSEGASPKVSL